jgi:hypothetical protein
MAFIAAEGRFPMAGIAREAAGRAELEFRPALSHFRFDRRDMTRPGGDAVSAVLAQAVGAAVPRYRQPAGIPRSWVFPFILTVNTDKSRWW